jgi:membrane fusion protein (multidrug efflux system)
MLVAVVAALAVAGGCKKPPPAPAAPAEVYVTPVVQQDVPVYLDLVGQTAGFQDIEIRARVEGFVDSVNFREGSFVHKGDLLYRIDPKPFQAALLEAKAEQEKAEAALQKTENDVARYTPLVSKQAVSRQELDNALSEREAAKAQVEAAKAAVERAALNLGYTRVTSPVDGLIGTTKVNPGDLVGHNIATVMTTVSQIDPIYFYVAPTEADFLRVERPRLERVGKAPQLGGIVLTLADGSVFPQKGRVGPIERAVNPATGTLGVKLIFPNPRYLLRPGQYGRARLLLETRRNALLIPQRAVQELQNLHSVAVVDANSKVRFRNVAVGPRFDKLWVIEKGLKPGEQVVAEGLQGISDGMTVRTRPMAVATTGSQADHAAHEAR